MEGRGGSALALGRECQGAAGPLHAVCRPGHSVGEGTSEVRKAPLWVHSGGREPPRCPALQDYCCLAQEACSGGVLARRRHPSTSNEGGGEEERKKDGVSPWDGARGREAGVAG